MGLLRDQAVAVEDAPDGGSGGDGLEALGQVVKDGLRTGVETCSRELSAKLEDGGFQDRADLVWTGLGAMRAGLDGSRTALFVASQQPEQPAARDRMSPG